MYASCDPYSTLSTPGLATRARWVAHYAGLRRASGLLGSVRQSLERRRLRHGRRDLTSLLRTLDALDAASLERKRAVTLPLLREVLQRDPTL